MTDAAEQLEKDIENAVEGEEGGERKKAPVASEARLHMQELPDEEFSFDWDKLPTNEDGTPYIEIGGQIYLMPYAGLMKQTMDPALMRKSIREHGISDPIKITDDEPPVIIGGNTRAYVAWTLGMKEIPTRVYEGRYDHPLMDAVADNAEQRKFSPAIRREMMKKIKAKMGWRSFRVEKEPRQKMLAQMFGVSESTISRDIDRLTGTEKEETLADKKRKITSARTGINYLQEFWDSVEVEGVSNEEVEAGRKYINALYDALEAHRDSLDEDDD
jgi:hypothetical protein